MNTSRNRRLAAFAAMGTIGLLASGCAVGTGGSGGDDDAQYDSGATLEGELSVMGFSGVDEVATSRMDLAEQELGDGVELRLIEGELDLQQFLSTVATGTPPDLIYANRDQIGSLAARDAILPLDRCIEGEGIDSSMYVESALAQVTLEGQIYGIPEFNVVQVTMANGDLLDAAGLSIDDVNGSDWDAMAAANEALMKRGGTGLEVIGVDSKLPEFFPLWAKAAGVDLLSEDGREANLDDPEAVRALEWAVSIYDAQGGFADVKAYRDSADFFGEGNQFASGVLGAMPMEQWYLNVLADVSPDAPVAFDTVRDHEGEPIAYASGSAWAIPAGAENPEAACRWARVMTSLDAWEAAAQARLELREAEGKPFTGILTGNAEADEMVRGMVTSGGEPWDSGVEAMYEANEHTFSLPANPADAEFDQAMNDAVNAVLTGQSEPAEALAEAQQVAQEALDEAWARVEGGE
ncbi:ABC transporter substrate-binding protein [Microbacterium sp. Marseille-Q6965]|uniref:ABC transporter substrate-binding protein n=1 Tax=Microbacterium sp. Marseille-Q6965 TaxID=2965072 RepID=UPI0021B73F59|nr:extracellular solute-binding protein [Microbacterium sp. Marseille-Q6965]